MSFREKSAWAMGAVMVFTGLLYLRLLWAVPADASPQSQLGPLIPYLFAVVVASIAVQVVLAIVSRGDPRRPADERERAAIHKAGHWAGFVLAAAAIKGAMLYLWQGEGAVLFQWLIGSLIFSQFAAYALQVYFFRRGV
ncbi:MAG: hypothetical protein ABIP41_09415 [Croceibacterium sp.]